MNFDNNLRIYNLGSDNNNDRYWYFQSNQNMLFVERYSEEELYKSNSMKIYILEKKIDIISLVDPLNLHPQWFYYNDYNEIEQLYNSLYKESFLEEKLYNNLTSVMPKIKMYENLHKKNVRKY